MKMAFFEMAKDQETLLKEAFPEAELSFFGEKLNEGNATQASETEILCVFVHSTVNKKVMEAMPGLKFIVTRSMGFNHIDCEYAKQKGIQIAYVPAYGSRTVAEFTFGLLLNLSRKIAEANGYLRESFDFNYYP